MVTVEIPKDSPIRKTKFWRTPTRECRKIFTGYLGMSFTENDLICLRFESEDDLDIFLLTVE